MDRYAVINSYGKVVNIIIWDEISLWKPPEGHRLEKNHELNIGDIWMSSLNEYVRPLSLLKLPEDEVSVAQRKSDYEAAKNILKKSIIFLDPHNSIDLNS